MSATETLESVAAMLPAERRERFLAMVARFRNVPEDDEYLQILEAIGFMTLLWKEVPEDILRVLRGANPVPDSGDAVSGLVRKAVEDAIPSYDDLKRITQRLESHEQLLARFQRAPRDEKPSGSRVVGRIAWLLAGLLAGLALPFP